MITSGAPASLDAPWEPLPAISDAARARLEAEVHRVNDLYLVDFIEEHSFCPFARSGRQHGQTRRYVYYADTASVEPLLERMLEIAADPRQVVVQVVLPLVDVGPREWERFVKTLTDVGNGRMDGGPVLACAPLHPGLSYRPDNANTIIPLFRRAPDPTIQWVRLDGLAAIYEGREGDTRYVDPAKLDLAALEAAPKPLYDRIADSNFSMAKRLGCPHIEKTLEGYAGVGRRRYLDTLLGDDDD